MAFSGSSPRSAAERARGDVDGGGRAERQDGLGEGAQAVRPGRAAGDDQPAATGHPGAQGGHLLGLQGRRVHVLPDQPVEGRPALHPTGQLGGGQRHDDGRQAGLVGQQVQAADDVARSLGHDPDDELGGVVAGELDLDAVDGRAALHEGDLHGPAEAGRLGVQPIDLVRLGRQVDGGPEARLAGQAAGQAQLAGDRGAVVLEVDVDAHPGALAGVPVEQDAGFHGQALDRGPGRGRGDAEQGQDHEQRGREPSRRAPTAGGGRGGLGVAHAHSVRGVGDGRSKDASAPPKVAPGGARRAYRTMGRSRGPSSGVPSRRARPRYPCPRSAPSAPCAMTCRRWATPRSWSRRPTTSSARPNGHG